MPGVALAAGAFLLLAGSARAQSEGVDVTDDAYSPAEVTIPIGGGVTWTVTGDHPHSVTSDDDGALFDSSSGCNSLADPLFQACMHKGDQFTLTFSSAGRYEYHCRVHGAAMSGTVIVDSTATTTSSGSGSSPSSGSSSPSSTSSSSSDGTDSSSSLSQAPPPTITSTSRVALPKSVTVRTRSNDDLAPWVLLDVFIAGSTAIAGVVLVRKGRVPFG